MEKSIIYDPQTDRCSIIFDRKLRAAWPSSIRILHIEKLCCPYGHGKVVFLVACSCDLSLFLLSGFFAF